MPGPEPLPPQALRRSLDPSSLPFKDTTELEQLEEIIGQDRAVRAVTFGIGIESPGFNIYALGPAGTGKMTTIRRFLEQKAAQAPVPDDWCYVNNFAEEHKPHALRLPAGRGNELRNDLEGLIKQLRADISKAFGEEHYAREREELLRGIQSERERALEEMDQTARQAGFALMRAPVGLMLTPLVDGQPLDQEQYQALSEERRKEIEERQKSVQEVLNSMLRQVQRLEGRAREQIEELDRRVARYCASNPIADLKEKYAEFEGVPAHLEAVLQDVVENVDDFKSQEQRPQTPLPGLRQTQEPSFDRYQVNLLVDNSGLHGAPVVVEPNPTYHNLVGRVDHIAQFGALTTHFTMIKPGALHRANGGYLLVEVRDLLTNPFAYDALKRALKTGCVRMEELSSQFRIITTQTLEPEPVPLDVKIVLLGNPLLYYLLHAHDDDFQELFKVKAEFAYETDWDAEHVTQYARFVGNIVREENLLPFQAAAVARVIEHAAREVSDQRKLGTQFGSLVDLVREAHYWATQDGTAERVSQAHVRQAVEARVYRANLIEERIREEIQRGTLRIETEGAVEGQVNGLSVSALGEYQFGKPSRVTARVFVGRQGVVNIEREIELSGRLHNKGVLILAGYLGGRYALKQPLTLSASITFEQTYQEIDGDSASSTELYALLSALSGFPLRQDVAVTGAVSQRGEVLPIGGVNQKVEGFFDVCRARGLNGRQGVMIPAGNVEHLMLRDDVVEAVRRGQFHVWPVQSVDEGIELLTGKPAGVRDEEGEYPQDTVHGAVQRRLQALAEGWRQYALTRDGGSEPAPTASAEEP